VAAKLLRILPHSERQARQDTTHQETEHAKPPQNLDWLKDWSTLVAVLTALLSSLFSPFLWDFEVGSYVALVASALSLLWLAWKIAPFHTFLRAVISVVIVAAAVVWGYLVYEQSQPRFEITALRTLEGDQNAYELTDMLIWNQDNLDEYGVTITFTVEIRPTYHGKRRFGGVVARFSGEGDSVIEKPLWDDFTKNSRTQQVHLTLPDLLAASGLKANSEALSNLFPSNGFPIEQATLEVGIVRPANPGSAWTTEKITIHNAPWELRAALVWTEGKGRVDTYVRNHGAVGDFVVQYHLVRLEPEIEFNTAPMNSGTTTIHLWTAPSELVRLESGSSFTDAVPLPDNLMAGRYLLEVYPLKKQNYVGFDHPHATW
jgi:hypothetical protein